MVIAIFLCALMLLLCGASFVVGCIGLAQGDRDALLPVAAHGAGAIGFFLLAFHLAH